MKKPSEIPLRHRHVVAIKPGIFFADQDEMHWQRKNWENINKLAEALRKHDPAYVAFRRFIYDPVEGQVFIDKGWVYFSGKCYSGDDVVAGKTDCNCGEIGISNIKNNHIEKVVYFHDSGKMYPLNKFDKFIEINK